MSLETQLAVLMRAVLTEAEGLRDAENSGELIRAVEALRENIGRGTEGSRRNAVFNARLSR